MLTSAPASLHHPIKFPGSDLDGTQEIGKPRILVVDDDAEYVSMMKLILRQADFDVSGAIDLSSAIDRCTQVNPDAILLDLMLPGADGYEILENIRGITDAPVMFVTAAASQDHLPKAFELGADDYITKPFNNREVIARLKKMLTQTGVRKRANTYRFPDIGLYIDLNTHEAFLNNTRLPLTRREFSLLVILAENAPHNVPYERISRTLWGEFTGATHAHLKTVAFALRRKLDQGGSPLMILVNNRSIGYQLIIHP